MTTTLDTIEGHRLDDDADIRRRKYIGDVVAEGERFARTAEAGDLDVAIAACPGWDMGDLVRHLGEVHLWAAAIVAFPTSRWLQVDELDDLIPYWPELAASAPPDDELVAWYRRTLANLVDVLTTADADVPAFALLPGLAPVLMWARRQASEIAVHRFDAEAARGMSSHFDPHFAADMLDELVAGFGPRYRKAPSEVDRVLVVSAVDVGQTWQMTMGPDGVRTERGEGPADLVVEGTAAELYLSMWNRTPDSTVRLIGDVDVMELWRATCRVRWTAEPTRPDDRRSPSR